MMNEVGQINQVLKEKAEIQSYTEYRKDMIRKYRLKQISADTLDSLERDLSAAHLERLRRIRKGY